MKNVVKKTIIIVFIIFLLNLITVYEVFAESITVNLIDINTQKPITEGSATYILKDKISKIQIEENILLYNSNTFNISVDKSKYTLIITTDKFENSGTRGIFQAELNIVGNVELNALILPTGSLSGSVVDKNNKPLDDVFIRIDCLSNYGIQGISKTNEIGSFSFKFLPLGNCKIGAAIDNSISFEDVIIEKDEHKNIVIKLDYVKENEFLKSALFKHLIFLSMLIIIILIILIFLKFKKNTKTSKDSNIFYNSKNKIINKSAINTNKTNKLNVKNNKINSKNNKIQIINTNSLIKNNKTNNNIDNKTNNNSDNYENRLNEKNKNIIDENKTNNSKEYNNRAKDILTTMSGNEREVLKFLLDNSTTTMAKIYYGTGIPKTSLARVLITLESKKIIKTEKLGKLKKVSLTDWFLEK